MNKDSIPFFDEPLVLLVKVRQAELFILKQIDSTLPAWRNVNIQVNKARRMIADFWKEFPTMFPESANAGLRRKSTAFRRRLAHQGNNLDVSIRRLLEEHAVQTVAKRGKKIGPRRVRSEVQKRVHALNKQIRKSVQDVWLQFEKRNENKSGTTPATL